MRQKKSYAIVLGLVIGFVILLVCVCGFFGFFFEGQSFKVVHEGDSNVEVIGNDTKAVE